MQGSAALDQWVKTVSFATSMEKYKEDDNFQKGSKRQIFKIDTYNMGGSYSSSF